MWPPLGLKATVLASGRVMTESPATALAAVMAARSEQSPLGVEQSNGPVPSLASVTVKAVAAPAGVAPSRARRPEARPDRRSDEHQSRHETPESRHRSTSRSVPPWGVTGSLLGRDAGAVAPLGSERDGAT